MFNQTSDDRTYFISPREKYDYYLSCGIIPSNVTYDKFLENENASMQNHFLRPIQVIMM